MCVDVQSKAEIMNLLVQKNRFSLSVVIRITGMMSLPLKYPVTWLVTIYLGCPNKFSIIEPEL